MKNFVYIFILSILVILSSCGAGTRSVDTAETTTTVCTVDSDCATGYSCSNNTCVANPQCTVDSDCGTGYTCSNNLCVASSSLTTSGFLSCEYFGFSSTIDSSLCNDGSSTPISFTSIQSDTTVDDGSTTDWKSGLAFMRVAEAQSLLSNQSASNIYGSGVKVAVIGSGVNNVVSTDEDLKEININTSLSANYGYAYNNTDSGGIFNEVTREYEGYSRTDWNLYSTSGDTSIAYDDYGKVTTGVVCDSDNTANCNDIIYTNQDYSVTDANGTLVFSDRDWFTYGSGDIEGGTEVASIIAKDSSENMTGVATESEVVSVKTQFDYQKTNYLSGTYSDTTYAVDNAYSYTLQDNTGIILNDALTYARANSDVVLFNNHLRYTTNDHTHYYFRNVSGNGVISCDYDLDNIECGSETDTSDYRSFSEIINQSSNAYFAAFKDQLNDTSDLYVTPVANSLISDLVSDSNSNDSRAYSTLLAVADVNVSSIAYCSDNTSAACSSLDVNGQDTYTVNGIESITLDATTTFKNSYDCSSIVSTHCLIAPANVYALSSTGVYTTVGSQEYSGSAYVAGIIAAIRGAYDSSVLSNEDIISKIIATATSPDYITGCDTVTGDCGAGMINFYEVIKASVSSAIQVSSASSNSFDLSSTSLSLSSAFGDGVTSNSMGILGKAVFFDDYNFAYNAGLDQKVVSAPVSEILVADLLADDQIYNSTNYNVGSNASFNVSTTQDDSLLSKRFTTGHDTGEVSTLVSNLKLTESIGKMDINVAFNTDYNNDIYTNPVIKSSGSYASLTEGDNHNSIGVSRNIHKNIALNSSWVNLGNDNLYVTGLDYTNNNTKATLSLGLLNEDGKILGAETSGAFGVVNSSNTHYVNLKFLHEVSSFEFFGNISTGITKIDMEKNSLVTDISDITTQELQLGINKTLNKKSSIGFSYTEPLRVTSGSMELTVPTHKDVSGEIAFSSETISVKPYGKERNYEIYFNKSLNDNTTLSVNLLKVTDSGNVDNSKDSDVLLVKFKKRF